MAAIRKLAAERGYTVCGSSTCLPGDYRDARAYLVSRNDIFDLRVDFGLVRVSKKIQNGDLAVVRIQRLECV
jgi:hypothetical protein